VDLEGQIVRRSGRLFSIRISLCFVEMLFRHRFALKSDAISVSLVPVEAALGEEYQLDARDLSAEVRSDCPHLKPVAQASEPLSGSVFRVRSDEVRRPRRQRGSADVNLIHF
jgi:hypothetical protein